MSDHLSPNQKAMRRLIKNKPALGGLIIIGLSVIVALLGYVIAPDSTPDANDQLPSIALKDPGFKVRLLALKKNREIESKGFFYKMFYGSLNTYEYVPINRYELADDSIIVDKYAGEDPRTGRLIYGLEEAFHVADIVYSLNNNDLNIIKNNTSYEINDIYNQKKSVSTEGVKKQAESQILIKKFYLGTDNFGRDILSRLILGVRISLLVGLIAVMISLTLGILLGAIAGYFGGKIDDIIMLIINTVWSIPTILLVFAIVLAFGRGVGIIFLAVGLTMWVDVARLVRGQVLSLKEMAFVEAAKSMGFNTGRILARHILPNILGPVMVIAASNFATAILIESGLSYLGFGIQPPTPSWGTMLNENYGYAIGGKPFLALIPALAIMLMVLAFNLVGNGFRDALDVKS
jgi:peptide/nickel transport system permease protein